MTERPEIWLVQRDEELVAELAVDRLDRPWLRGTVTRREGFAALAPLFAREAHLAATMGATAGWWAAYRELRTQIRLIRPDGREVPEFILHIDRSQARWRCLDPIPEDSFGESTQCERRLGTEADCSAGGHSKADVPYQLGNMRFADAHATTKRGWTGTITDPAISTIDLSPVSGGPPLGPPRPHWSSRGRASRSSR
jgi:hypothetical protein